MSETYTPDHKVVSDGGAAFPGFSYTDGRGNQRRNEHSGEWETFEAGMSVRVWLCGHAPAMPSCYSEYEHNSTGVIVRTYSLPERHARWRAEYADAQIAILEGRPIPQLQSPQ